MTKEERTREKHGEEYNKAPHRIACCTFCCAILYCVLAFLIGGPNYQGGKLILPITVNY